MEKGLADRLKEAMGAEVKDLSGHLTEMQILVRQMQTFFLVIEELVEIGGEEPLDLALSVAELGGALAKKANLGLDSTTLAALGLGA